MAPSATTRRAVTWTACAWAVVFGAPHLWWALGVPYGFPGGQASYDFFMSSAWRVVYDWVVVVMSALAVAIALELQKPPEKVRRRRIPLGLAWFACGILLLRGIAGAIVDGRGDLVWNPLFLAGGVAMGALAFVSTTRQINAKP